MSGPVFRMPSVLTAVTLLVSSSAVAQGQNGQREPAPVAAAAPTPGNSIVPPPIAVVPTSAPQAAGPDAASGVSTASTQAAAGMKGAVGFGVGILPNVELLGTSGAVALKAWLSESLAIAPLLGFSYTSPKDMDASWHLRPEFVVLFAPFKNASTRLEFGGGIGFAINKAPALESTFDLTLPIQAGVEHFFTRWFSVGIAARTDLVAYTEQGDFHQIAFSVDSTSLLGQLFFYTD